MLQYIPQLKPSLFWDTSIEGIDYENDSIFIINRVFNYGNFQEVADIIVCYSRKYVLEVLLASADLNIFGLSKASAFLGIPESEFKCYIHNPYPTNY